MDIGAQCDVSRASRLEGDGVRVEVPQHVGHGVEPQVVDVALAGLVHRQTQMLRKGVENGRVQMKDAIEERKKVAGAGRISA